MTTRCPKCKAQVIAIRTPLGEDVLLDPRPVTECYTLNQCIVGMGMPMPSDVLRARHKCEVKP